MSTPSCTLCRDVGWILDSNDLGKPGPRMLELLPCPIPDCPSSGQPIQNITLRTARFTKTSQHPTDGYVMSVHTPDRRTSR